MSDDPGDLNRLRDIVMPDPATWWPLAPGWLVLSAVVLAVGTWLTVRAVRNYRANAFRRAALHLLESSTSDAEISALLKRTAMVIAGRDEVASLSGESWCDWLSARGERPMADDERAAIMGGIYDESRSHSSSLKAYAASWIKGHEAVVASKEVTR